MYALPRARSGPEDDRGRAETAIGPGLPDAVGADRAVSVGRGGLACGMATVPRRRFGAMWVVALALATLLGSGGDRQTGVAGVSDRALAAVASVASSSVRGDVVVPRADGRALTTGQLSHG